MTDPELFKYDVRVRERMLRKGLINESEVEKRLQGLPDVEGQCIEFELKQPALHRHEQEAPSAPRVAAAVSAPSAIATASEPLRSSESNAFAMEEPNELAEEDDDDDDDDELDGEGGAESVSEDDIGKGWGDES